MQSTKVITTLWVIQKKPVKSFFTLDPEYVEDVQDIGNNTVDNYIKAEMPFNSLMTQFFEGSNIEEQIQRMFAHFKTQVENSSVPERGFTLDWIMHLHINFHKLALTHGSSYTELPKWIAKKAVIITERLRKIINAYQS